MVRPEVSSCGLGLRIILRARFQDGDEIGHRLAILRHGRKSPCAITRLICSCGCALIHTVCARATAAHRSPVKTTMPPAVAITTLSWSADHLLERRSFVAAEGDDTGHLDQHRDVGAIFLLHHAIEFDKRIAERRQVFFRVSTCRRRAGRRVRSGAHVRTSRFARRAFRSALQARAIPTVASRSTRSTMPSCRSLRSSSGSSSVIGLSNASATAFSTSAKDCRSRPRSARDSARKSGIGGELTTGDPAPGPAPAHELADLGGELRAPAVDGRGNGAFSRFLPAADGHCAIPCNMHDSACWGKPEDERPRSLPPQIPR